MEKKIRVSLRQLDKFLVFILLILLAGGIGFRLGERRHTIPVVAPDKKADLSLFWYVWQRLGEKYLNKTALDSRKMVYGAISGMVSSLDDPYTAFFPPSDNAVNKEGLKGEFGGVGIQLGYKKDTLVVMSPLENTPASRAGIKAEDLILRIQDKTKGIDRDTENISLPEAVKLIRGKEGTKVTLTLAREGGEKPFDVVLVREQIVIPSLTSRWLEVSGEKIAYIHLSQFSEVMYNQWDKWVGQIEREKNKSDFRGIILDLRNNPGGFLDGAVYVAGEFIAQGTVVEQESGSSQKQKFPVNRKGRLVDVPLVVLVNRGSASAAEILAGAIQYYQRAKLVGEKTFGKGTVQEPEDLPDGSGLHITISRWLLPGGKNIDKEGVSPDVEVKDEIEEETKDPVFDKGKEVLLNIKS